MKTMKKYYFRYLGVDRYALFYDGQETDVQFDITSEFIDGYATVYNKNGGDKKFGLLFEKTGNVHYFGVHWIQLVKLYGMMCALVRDERKENAYSIYILHSDNVEYMKTIYFSEYFSSSYISKSPSKYIVLRKEENYYLFDLEKEEKIYEKRRDRYNVAFYCNIFPDTVIVAEDNRQIAMIHDDTVLLYDNIDLNETLYAILEYGDYKNGIFIPIKAIEKYPHIFFNRTNNHVLYYRDYLVFRDMKKLSMKDIGEIVRLFNRYAIIKIYDEKTRQYLDMIYEIDRTNKTIAPLQIRTFNDATVHFVCGNILFSTPKKTKRIGRLFDNDLKPILLDFEYEYANSEYVAIRKEDGRLSYIDGFGNRI